MSSPTERPAPARARVAGKRIRRTSGATRYAGFAAAALAFGLAVAFLFQTGAFNVREAKKSDPPAVVEYPDQISGSNATITGHDKNQKPFAIKAAKGQQDKAVKTLVHLQHVVGNFERESGNPMDVSANSGRYDTATKKFELQGNVVLSEGSTMKALMEVAEINTLDQSLQSSGPVTVDMKGTTIKAGSLSVSENGTRVLFRGGVKARFVTNTAATGDGG
jgi:lipopolysaccharide export system protein LptC